MHHLALADQYAAKYGVQLSDSARRSLAIGLGLGGSGVCDDAFLSIGLRRSNSVLALLTDKYHLDFSVLDEDAEADAESRGDIIIDEELRRLGAERRDLDPLGPLLFDADLGYEDSDYTDQVPPTSSDNYEDLMELI